MGRIRLCAEQMGKGPFHRGCARYRWIELKQGEEDKWRWERERYGMTKAGDKIMRLRLGKRLSVKGSMMLSKGTCLIGFQEKCRVGEDQGQQTRLPNKK